MDLSRREFIKKTIYFIISSYGIVKFNKLSDFIRPVYAKSSSKIVIADCSKRTIQESVKAVIDELGGIKQFIKKGSKVVIKPNMSFARSPRFAATTSPDVVKAIIKLCEQAYAKEIIVIDHIIDFPAMIVFKINKMNEVTKATSAKLIAANKRWMYKKIKIKDGKGLKEDEVLEEVLNCDTFINVPVAKHHSTTDVSLSLKNLMGIIYDRWNWHKINLNQCIADFATFIKPHLIIIDATRVLLSNGPRGIRGKVITPNKIIASLDLVAADSYITKEFFNKNPQDITHINYAYKLGIGEINLDKVKVVNV